MVETMNNEVYTEPIIELVGLETEETEIEVDGVVYIEKSTYRVYNDGTKELACSARYPKPSDEPIAPVPTQLDRIEETVNHIATGTDESTAAMMILAGMEV